MTEFYKVYVGWDTREDVAYKVLRHSIMRKTKSAVDVIPLKHKELRQQGLFFRPWLTDGLTGHMMDVYDHRPFSTEFSHTRFLVPVLEKFKGWALFMDCDMLFQTDLKKLFELCDDRYAAMVVKHNHNPPEGTKMDGQLQARYYRKNWSSFILWNCGHPANYGLDINTVNTKPGSWLHAFEWLSDDLIGHLGYEWNWIEGVSPAMPYPKVIHYTEGGPWFDNCQDVLFAENWVQEYERWQRNGDFSITNVPTTKYGG